jgi:hypothetical protein
MEGWVIAAALAAWMVWSALRTLASFIRHEIESRRLERETRELRAWYEERLRRKRSGETDLDSNVRRASKISPSTPELKQAA